MTYKPLAKDAIPAYGTIGDANLTLQNAINSTNPSAKLATDKMYGDKTKAAYDALVGQGYTYANGAFTKTPPVTPTTPTPGSTPTDPATDPTRYTRTAGAYDAKIADLTAKLDASVGPAPDKQAIIDEKRRNAQLLVDSITAEFQRTLNDQTTANEGYNARVRASNISSGLGGSDFATANAVGQEKKNQQAIDMINQEKSTKIAAVLAGIDDRASEQYRLEREAYVKSLGDNLDRVKAAKEEDRNKALDSIKSLASQGVNVDKLKAADPKTYDALLAEYGGSKIDLESAWNAALPDNMKIKYTEKMVKGPDGNTIVYRYGIDPLNPGQIKENSYNVAVPYETLASGTMDETKDGRIIMKYPDGTIKYLTNIDALTASTINKNNADAAKTRADAAGGGDASVTQDLKDAKTAIDNGKDPLLVRQAFLAAHPAKSTLYTTYFKEQY